MQLQFFWDSQGDPRAECEAPCRPVASFLESDLQGSAGLGREILRTIARIEAGELDGWEVTGNAYTLTLDPGTATIEPLWSEEEPFELPLSQIRDAIADWIAFLDNGRA